MYNVFCRKTKFFADKISYFANFKDVNGKIKISRNGESKYFSEEAANFVSSSFFLAVPLRRGVEGVKAVPLIFFRQLKFRLPLSSSVGGLGLNGTAIKKDIFAA